MGASPCSDGDGHRHRNCTFTFAYTLHPLSPVIRLELFIDDIAHIVRYAVNHRRNTFARQQERVSSALSAALSDRSLCSFSKGHTQASRRCAAGSE